MEQFGASRGRNVGIKASSGSNIAFTDDDCEARSDWLATIIGCFEKTP